MGPAYRAAAASPPGSARAGAGLVGAHDIRHTGRHEHRRRAAPRPHRASSRACPRPSCTCTTWGRRRRGSWPSSRGRHPDSPVPQDPEALARFFTFTDFAHFIEVYLATVGLLRTARGRADADLRGRPRPRRPAGALRRADHDALHVGGARHPHRGVHRGDRGRAGRGRARPRRRAAVDLRHPRRVGAGVRRRDPVVRAAATGRRHWSGSASAGRRSACRGRSSQPHFTAARAAGLHSVPHSGESTGPQSVWDALTPARRRADRPRHVVGAGPARCSSTSPSTASRSRCARRATSRPGSSSGSRSTRSGPCATPASS